MKPFLCLLILLASPLAEAQTPPSGLVPFRRATKWGYVDQRRRLVLPLQYDEAGPFVGGVAWVRQGTLLGYITTNGNPVTPLQYTRAGNFHGGRATVELGGETFDIDPGGQRLTTAPEPAPETDVLSLGHRTHQDGKLGFRFTVGHGVVPAQYDDMQETASGLLLVRQGLKWGVINGKGKLVQSITYDALQVSLNSDFPIVEQQGRFGYLTADGHLLVKPKYRAAEFFSEGVARVITESGQVGYIDARGEEYFEE
ncbi:MAG TPA: WG repeat-containing protein [Hymenobacter sp.]|jgi:hypothetical protein